MFYNVLRLNILAIVATLPVSYLLRAAALH